MRISLVVLALAVQIVTVSVLFAVSGEDTQAYPMEAGYLVKNQDLHLVYYEGAPAQMTYEKMEGPEKNSKVHVNSPVTFKHSKNLRCERRELDGQPAYRCAVDLRKI